MSKEHEHNYVAEKYTAQKADSIYLGNQTYKPMILDIQKIILFCTKCGHKIDEANPPKKEQSNEK